VKAQVQLPVVALGHHGRGDPAQVLVEVLLVVLRAEDHVRLGGVRRGEVEVGQRRDDLDAAGLLAQVSGRAPAGQRRADRLDAERQRVAERVGRQRHGPLRDSGHLRALQHVHRVLHLQRAPGLARLVEPGLLAARQGAHEGKGDHGTGAHERYY
jgi:hypothetical protein